MHRLIRTGRSLFTAHTNADSASPGVSDALAHALGLTVEAVLEPDAGRGGSGQVGHLRAGENAEAVQAAVFEAGAGHIGDYSHCSWSVTGTGQFLPHDGASPAMGSVGTVERVTEDRFEVVAPARVRADVLSAMRAAHPYEEPAFDIFAMVPLPGDAGLGRIGTLPQPEPLRDFVSRVGARAAANVLGSARRGGSRRCRVAGRGLRGRRATRCWAAAAARTCRPMSPLICATIRPTSIAGPREVALIDVAHWASEFPWCEPGCRRAAVAHSARRCRCACAAIRTDPWNCLRTTCGGEES